VFHVPCPEKRAPVHVCGGRVKKKGRNGTLQERCQAGEGCLAVLAQRDVFVRLERLHPCTKGEAMAAARPRNLVFEGKKVAVDGEVTAVVAPSEANLCLRIRSSTTSDYDSSDRVS